MMSESLLWFPANWKVALPPLPSAVEDVEILWMMNFYVEEDCFAAVVGVGALLGANAEEGAVADLQANGRQ